MSAPLIFADALQEANLVHDVLRLRLARAAAGGKLEEAGTVALPLGQLRGLVQALNGLLAQLDAQRPGIAPDTAA